MCYHFFTETDQYPISTINYFSTSSVGDVERVGVGRPQAVHLSPESSVGVEQRVDSRAVALVEVGPGKDQAQGEAAP